MFFQFLHIFGESISELVKLKMSEKLSALNTVFMHSRQTSPLCCRVSVRVSMPFVVGGMEGRMGYMPRGSYFLCGGLNRIS